MLTTTCDTPTPLRSGRVWIAAPKYGQQKPIAILTDSVADLHAHLRALGINPETCWIGNGTLASAEFAVDWDKTIYQAFA